MRLFFAIVITAFSASVQANGDISICMDISRASKSVMESRQNGAPMDAMIEIMQKGDLDADNQRIFLQIIVAAYETPKFSIEENKTEAATEFASDQLVKCIKAMS